MHGVLGLVLGIIIKNKETNKSNYSLSPQKVKDVTFLTSAEISIFVVKSLYTVVVVALGENFRSETADFKIYRILKLLIHISKFSSRKFSG